MATPPSPAWLSAFVSQVTPVDNAATAANNLANWINALVSGQLSPNPATLSSGTFTWNPAPFIATIASAAPSDSPSASAVIADAWEGAINASVLLVLPGAFVGVSSPATMFSVVSSVSVLPPTVAAAKAAMIASLASAPGVLDASQSQFPDIIRTAFLSISYSVSGMNTLPPPSGPTPLATVCTML